MTKQVRLKGLVEEDDWETAEQLIRKVWDICYKLLETKTNKNSI